MSKFELRLINGSLFTFITLVIMNSIKFVGGVGSIGSVGKLVFALSFIGFVLVAINRSKFKFKLLNLSEFVLIIFSILLFTLIFIYTNRSRINLLPNLAFPIYFIFYYFIIKLNIRANLLKSGQIALEVVRLNILYVVRKAMYINFFFWFALAIAFNINMFEIDGGFGGFFQDEIHFGLYMVTGFLISFYMRFNDFYKDRSKLNLLLLIVYGALLLYTSRNALLIVVIAIGYYFVISRIRNWVYSTLLLLTPIVLGGLNLFLQGLSFQKLNEITSGRFQIWSYLVDNIIENNTWLFGSGLFNLNDIILKENIGKGSAYLDSLRSLSFHSSYMELMAAGGLIVLFLFIRIVLKTWMRLNGIDRGIMIGILMGALFESFLVQPFMLLSSLFYIILILHSIKVKIAFSDNLLGHNHPHTQVSYAESTNIKPKRHE